MAEEWPLKQPDIFNHHMESAIWGRVPVPGGRYRCGDLCKFGTIWLQYIVLQLSLTVRNDST